MSGAVCPGTHGGPPYNQGPSDYFGPFIRDPPVSFQHLMVEAGPGLMGVPTVYTPAKPFILHFWLKT